MPVRDEPPPPANSKQIGVTKSLLYNGSKFQGFQKSKGNSYTVEVVLQVNKCGTLFLFLSKNIEYEFYFVSGHWSKSFFFVFYCVWNGILSRWRTRDSLHLINYKLCYLVYCLRNNYGNNIFLSSSVIGVALILISADFPIISCIRRIFFECICFWIFILWLIFLFIVLYFSFLTQGYFLSATWDLCFSSK